MKNCEPITLLSLDRGVVVPDCDGQRSQLDGNRAGRTRILSVCAKHSRAPTMSPKQCEAGSINLLTCITP